MSWTLRASLIFFLVAGLLPAAGALAATKAKTASSYVLPVMPSYKRLAAQTNDFYAWYIGALNSGIYPMESARDELSKYVTERLIKEISLMPKGSGGLDGDYFLNAQEWEPEWERNVRVSKVVFDQGVVRQDVVLAGPKSVRRLAVYLVQEGSAWKIDRVEPGA